MARCDQIAAAVQPRRHKKAFDASRSVPSPLRAVGATLLRQVAVHYDHLDVSAEPRNYAVNSLVQVKLRRSCTDSGNVRTVAMCTSAGVQPAATGEGSLRCRQHLRDHHSRMLCAPLRWPPGKSESRTSRTSSLSRSALDQKRGGRPVKRGREAAVRLLSAAGRRARQWRRLCPPVCTSPVGCMLASCIG